MASIELETELAEAEEAAWTDDDVSVETCVILCALHRIVRELRGIQADTTQIANIYSNRL